MEKHGATISLNNILSVTSIFFLPFDGTRAKKTTLEMFVVKEAYITERKREKMKNHLRERPLEKNVISCLEYVAYEKT